MWRAGFGRGFGPVVRQTTKRNECTARKQKLSQQLLRLHTALVNELIQTLYKYLCKMSEPLDLNT